MNVLYLILIILFISAQHITRKPYTKRTEGKGAFLFSLLSVSATLLFFFLTSGELHFEATLLPYSALFALAYGLGTVFTVLAVSCGPLSLTTLILSYALLLPTVYGLAVLHDPIRVWFFPGICLLVISLFLLNRKSEKSAPITAKWLLYVILAFLGEGGCTVSLKMQQVAFNGAYKNEFMCLALSLVVITLCGCLVFSNERKHLKTYVKSGWYLAPLCGIFNGIVNLLVMVLSGPDGMAASVMFPLISAGGIVTTYCVSRFLYKEQLSPSQQWALILGIGSVVFLNL